MNDILAWIPLLLSGAVTFYNLYSVVKKTVNKNKQNDELIEISKMIKKAESNLISVNKLCMHNRGNAVLYDNRQDVENLQKILKEIYMEVENCKKTDENIS